MPSSFPGMDPYLEGSEWTSVHANLIEEIGRQLAPKLRPKYVVRSVRRFIMDMPDEIAITAQATYPNVGVLNIQEPDPSYNGDALLDALPPLQIPTLIPDKVPVTSLEIRDVNERSLVTAIEVMSPANKRGRGYREYLEKREGILQSMTHLLEIDSLRKGKRVPMLRPLPGAPYFVFLSRREKRPIIEVWPIQFSMKLPAIPVPLLPEDDDVLLDLQLALDTTYDVFGYDLSVDYRRPPEVPLDDKAAEWAAQLLAGTGSRPHR